MTYQHSEVLIEPVFVVIQGTRLPDGGCGFSAELVRPAGSVTLADLEYAYDPDTCQSLRGRGRVADGSADPVAGGTLSDSVTVGTGGTDAINSIASWHAWFEDPIDLHVNDVTNSVAWSPNGTCAFPPGTTATMSYHYQWFTPTGWSLEDNNWNNSAACSGVISSSYVHFRNRAFCAAISPILFFFPTDTYYDRNAVTGRADGSAVGSTSWSKSGPCSGLLSFNAQFD